MSFIQRLLSPVVQVRREEALTALLMFANSFTAITAYTAIKPVTRSAFIDDFGADNLPYVQLAAGFIIGFLMTGYAWILARLPRRWALPIVQFGMAALVLAFWVLFQTKATWVSAAFYVFGLILAVLLISQFWTLANLVYDPRQAKRLFGFIGGGASLGGVAGSTIAAYAKSIGSVNLLLPSAVIMALGGGLAAWVIRREHVDTDAAAASASSEKGVGLNEAFNLLRQSRHLQTIALVISFGAVGAAIVDQQVNMAAAQTATGPGATDAITKFLALVQLGTSSIGFVVQVWLTSRIHRYLGIGFALMVLPISLGISATVILLSGLVWAAALARVLDTSLRYTVDKTTREILFLPLTGDIKLKAKSFVDVTVDRGAKALGAILLLVLVKPWGFNLDWQRLSYASLTMMALWIFMALRARRGYLTAFRQSIERRDLAPAEVRLNAADLSTVEALVEELAHPDAARVIYAIDLLESLDKRNLVTPLLLHHEDAEVRGRALRAIAAGRPQAAARNLPQVRRLLADPDAAVRATAISAIAAIGHEDVATLTRPLLEDPDTRIRTTAAVALAGTSKEGDVALAESTLLELSGDPEERTRRDVAAALRQIPHPQFRRLLIPLLYDASPEVADEAMESVRLAGITDFVFVPALVSLLRHRRLKGRARAVLVSYGEPVIDVLAHFMRDADEDIWVRRHIPATLAQIRAQKSVDVLIAALAEPDGFLRYKVVAALERLRREAPALVIPREPIEALALGEGARYFNYLSLHDNLFGRQQLPADSLLGRALDEKMERTRDRIFRLLSLIYPWTDIAAAQWTLQHGDARGRASASEYLDNVLTGQVRRRIMPILEDMPAAEKVRRGNVLLKTRPRDVEETLLQLINDDDQVVAATAIDVVRQQQMWSLGDDVEHVLAHRDVRDWYVFEAASWALAERRMPAARRRELWLEPLPAAELAGRLRALPLFAGVSVDELFRVAGASRQVRHESGSVLLQEGAAPESVHLLLDGRVTSSNRDSSPRPIEAPATLGFDEALQGLPMRQTIRSSDLAVTLVLSGEELRTLLSDNTDLVRGLFATLTGRVDVPGCSPVDRTGAAHDLEQLAADGLLPVEKMLALGRVPVFSRVSAHEMRHLAAIARTVEMKSGSALFPQSAEPAVWLVLSGEVALEDAAGGTQIVARAGDTIGTLCTVGGRPLGMSADVLRSGISLRIDRDELFDLLGERPELLRQLFAGMFALEPAGMGQN